MTPIIFLGPIASRADATASTSQVEMVTAAEVDVRQVQAGRMTGQVGLGKFGTLSGDGISYVGSVVAGVGVGMADGDRVAVRLAVRVAVGEVAVVGMAAGVGRTTPTPERPADGHGHGHALIFRRLLPGGQVVIFRGGEESDLLHAAADWMADHRDATILAIGWQSDHVHEDDEVPAWRLDLAVDMGNYQ